MDASTAWSAEPCAEPLELSPLELLTTTRAVRGRLDLARPVPRSLLARCLEIAMQAPNRANRNPARFVVVDELSTRAEIAAHYRRAAAERRARSRGGAQSDTREERAAAYLAGHLHEVPVLVLPCIARPPSGSGLSEQASTWGSILPACWSFMLAARLHRLGTVWTTVHLVYADEVAACLQLPPTMMQTGLIPVAWSVGTSFRPGRRGPLADALHWNGWKPTEDEEQVAHGTL